MGWNHKESATMPFPYKIIRISPRKPLLHTVAITTNACVVPQKRALILNRGKEAQFPYAAL